MRKIFTDNFFKLCFLIIKQKGPQTQAPTLVSVHTDKLQPKIHNNNYTSLIRINLSPKSPYGHHTAVRVCGGEL